MPNERTEAIVRAWEFLRRLTMTADTPATLRTEASALLRHYPQPNEIIRAAQLRPDLFDRPVGYLSDVGKPNTVSTLMELLSRFEPHLPVVLDGPGGGFTDLRQIRLVSLGSNEAMTPQIDNSPLTVRKTRAKQVVWLTGNRLDSADASDVLDPAQNGRRT